MSPDLQRFFDRPPPERDVYSKLKDLVLRQATDEQTGYIPSIVFAMIKPGAFARGLAPDVIEHLRLWGFRISLARVKEISKEELDELYLFVKQKYASSWWIMPKVYSLARVVPMILVGEPRGYASASDRLRDLIGPTTPEAGSPGMLRYDLKGTNRVFNILHVSDDPASALREGMVFFGTNEVLNAPLGVGGEELSEHDVVPTRKVKLSRWEIFNRVKLRCSSFFDHHHLNELLGRELDLVSRNMSIDEERRFLAEIEKELSELAASMRAEVEREAVDRVRSEANVKAKKDVWHGVDSSLIAAMAIELLSDEIKLSREAGFDLLLLKMMSIGAVKDDWEEAIIHSTWAVLPQMIKDFGDRGKRVLTGLR